MQSLAIQLNRSALWRLAVGLGCCNLLFISGMLAFLRAWEHREHFGPRGRAFIDYALVQFHLGAENVVAAWYSSMLLLLVATACATAFALDRRSHPARAGVSRFVDYGWIVLAASFTALSLDEIGSFHERIGMLTVLNRVSLEPHATTALGWVVVLALPIAAFAIFMLAFGWLRFRRVPSALALLALGVALYVCDPLLEVFEQAVKDRAALLLLERVLEEGVAELGGTCCILFGVLLYARRVGGDGCLAFEKPRAAIIIAVTAGLTALIPLAHAAVRLLPPADTGIPENWFPSAVLFELALVLAALQRQRGSAFALVLSAAFGAGLYGYIPGGRDNRVWIAMVVTALAGAATASVSRRGATAANCKLRTTL